MISKECRIKNDKEEIKQKENDKLNRNKEINIKKHDNS